MKKIFLYGVPGSGKTSIAKELHKILGYKDIKLDRIRTRAQIGKTAQSDPFLFNFTTSAWRQFGELSNKNAIKGLLAVRKSMKTFIIDEIQKYAKPIIAEAAFLDPSTVDMEGQYFLIICSDKSKHYNQFFIHREKSPETDQQFEAAKYIEKFLIEEAERLGVLIIDNTISPDEIAALIISKTKKD